MYIITRILVSSCVGGASNDVEYRDLWIENINLPSLFVAVSQERTITLSFAHVESEVVCAHLVHRKHTGLVYNNLLNSLPVFR